MGAWTCRIALTTRSIRLIGSRPADGENVVAVRPRLQPAGERRRMVKRGGLQAVELLKASGHPTGIGEDPPGLAQHPAIEADQCLPNANFHVVVGELAVGRAAQLIGRPVLVNEPSHFAGMPDEVGRKPRRDDEIYVVGPRRAKVEHAPRGSVGEDLARWMPGERKRNQLREMPAVAKLRSEVAHVRLGAARHERHLRGADEDPLHAGPC